MERAPEEISRDMLIGALSLGSKVANVVYHPSTIAGSDKLWIRAIKPKDRRHVGFVVDPFWNIRGFASNDRGLLGMQPVDIGDVLARDRFAVLIFGGDGDPRGVPATRHCYNPWYVKSHAWPAWLRYLHQFGSPSVIGMCAPDAHDRLDDDGEAVSPEEDMMQSLLTFEAGTALAIPHGADVKTLFAGGDGKAYVSAFDLINREISYALLHQVRATMEAEHGSRADSDTGKDVMDLITDGLQLMLARMWRRDVLMPWVRLNYGEDEAYHLCPVPIVGGSPREDFAANADAAAKIDTYIGDADDLREEMDIKLFGFSRDMEAWRASQEKQQAQNQAQTAQAETKEQFRARLAESRKARRNGA
jgi:hypothetical protein